MNQDAKDLKKLTLNIEIMNKKLEYLSKQIDKNRIKYPLGITYDQLYANIYVVVKNGEKRNFNIVRTL